MVKRISEKSLSGKYKEEGGNVTLSSHDIAESQNSSNNERPTFDKMVDFEEKLDEDDFSTPISSSRVTNSEPRASNQFNLKKNYYYINDLHMVKEENSEA